MPKNLYNLSNKHLIAAFAFFFICKYVLATPYHKLRFEHLGLEDGLSQSTVTSIIQDNQGFMWFGTQDGLNKYDGYSFTTYRHDPDNSTSINNNFINCIFQGEKYIWVGTTTGLNQYDPVYDHFTYLPLPNSNDENSNSISIKTLLEDKEGILWIGTSKGLVSYHTEKNQFEFYQNEANRQNISIKSVKALWLTDNNTIWIGTNFGLIQYNKITKTFTKYNIPSSNTNNISITSLCEDQKNFLWIGTNAGLFRLDKISRQIIHYKHNKKHKESLSSNNIHTLNTDSKGVLWIGTHTGINKYNPATNTFIQYNNKPEDRYSLSHGSIRSICEDASGLLWFGTFGGGINICDPSIQRFHHYQFDSEDPASLSDNHIYSIFEDSKYNLWIGTLDGGLNKKIKGSNQFIRYQNHPQNPQSLSDNNLRAVTEDAAGNIWIGSYNGYIDKLNPETDKITRFFTLSDYIPANRSHAIRSLYTDSDYLWIGTYGNCYRLNTKTKDLISYNSHLDPTGIVRTFFKDSDNRLWLCSSGGLYQYQPQTDSFIQFSHKKNNPESISTNETNFIMEHSDGSLWIGTFAGLNHYNKKTGVFKHYRTKDGLPNDVVYGIYEDSKGKLWMSTNYGISQFDPQTEQFANYNTKDGLQGSEFNAGAHYQGHDDALYFGGMNGINIFHPDNINTNTYLSPVVFTNFLLFNKPITLHDSTLLNKQINYTNKITLHYQDYIFAFEFSALNYRQQTENKYIYRLVGFDKDWRKADYLQNRATYTNLPFGQYTFQVKASNDDGIWNETIKEIKVRILPPFWKTWWFRTLIAGIILGIIAAIILWRFLDLRSRNIKLSKLVAERTHDLEISVKELEKSHAEKDRFFSIIAHDLRSPFNTINSYIHIINEHQDTFTKQELKDFTKNLKENTEATFKLLENLLSWSRSQTGRIKYHPESANLKSIASFSVAALEHTASFKGIHLSTQISDDLFVNVDIEMINTVFRNLVSNAIKFTEKDGSVTISAEKNSHLVHIKVTDTGIGMSPETLDKLFRIDTKISQPGTNGEAGSGLGLILCKEFLDKHGSQLMVESEKNKGSRFSFTLSKSEESQ